MPAKIIDCILCESRLRIPAGRGTLRVTCPLCRSEWEVYSGEAEPAEAKAPVKPPSVPQEPQESWLRRHGSAIAAIAVLYYLPISGLLALIHPQLGRAALVVGATAAAIMFLPLFILGLPGLLMLCGGALALGGIAQQDPGTYFVGGVMAVVGYIWSKNQSGV